jgi:stage II sporulation protein AB (anti-sigma F factor)
MITMRCHINGNELTVEIEDTGAGIKDISKAMEPLYTTRPELERSGMGFSFMEAFMDQLEVESTLGKGTIVRMKKKIGKQAIKEYTQETGLNAV